MGVIIGRCQVLEVDEYELFRRSPLLWTLSKTGKTRRGRKPKNISETQGVIQQQQHSTVEAAETSSSSSSSSSMLAASQGIRHIGDQRSASKDEATSLPSVSLPPSSERIYFYRFYYDSVTRVLTSVNDMDEDELNKVVRDVGSRAFRGLIWKGRDGETEYNIRHAMGSKKRRNEKQASSLGETEKRQRNHAWLDGFSGIGSLALKYGCPPFSVLDSKRAYWQHRKYMWLETGCLTGNQ